MRQVNDLLAAKTPTVTSSGRAIVGYGQPSFPSNPAAPLADTDPAVAASKRELSRDDTQQRLRWDSMPYQVKDATGQHGFMTPDERDAYIQRRDARQATQDAAAGNVGRVARVNALMRRSRLAGSPLSPVFANLFVGAGLAGGPESPKAITQAEPTGMGPRNFDPTPPMNAAMMALFPDLAKARMQADAYGAAARERNAVDLHLANATDRKQKIEAIGQLARIEEEDFDNKIARATSDQDRQRLTAEKSANRRARLAQVAQLAGIEATPATSGSGNDRGPADLTDLISPGSLVSASNGTTTPIGASSNVGPLGRFPQLREGTPEEMRRAVAGFRPSFEDFTAADPWTSQALNGLTGENYRPHPAEWVDKTGNGPSPDDSFATAEAQRYQYGAHHARQMLDQMTRFIQENAPSKLTSNIPVERRLQAVYTTLKRQFPHAGEDALRVAMAKAYDRPHWLRHLGLTKGTFSTRLCRRRTPTPASIRHTKSIGRAAFPAERSRARSVAAVVRHDRPEGASPPSARRSSNPAAASWRRSRRMRL
jgi:hypothetical protein